MLLHAERVRASRQRRFIVKFLIGHDAASNFSWARLITVGLLLFSHLTSSSIRSNSLARSVAATSSLMPYIGSSSGSFNSDEKTTARRAASGRIAHHKCNVEGCPCRIDFSLLSRLLINGLQRNCHFDHVFTVGDHIEDWLSVLALSFESVEGSPASRRLICSSVAPFTRRYRASHLTMSSTSAF